MNSFSFVMVNFLIFSVLYVKAQSQKDLKALEQTSINIRKAFAEQDLETIQAYHHPEVVKALGFDKVLKGREAVMNDLKETFKNYQLDFQKNEVESLLIEGDIAVEQTLFEIKIIFKDDDGSFLFKGRTMVVYQRYKESPTGWASIREIIQAEPN